MQFIELGNAASIKMWHVYLSIHTFTSLGNQLTQFNSLTPGTKQTKMFSMKFNEGYKMHKYLSYL